MVLRRKDNPRIKEIEKEIGKLSAELLSLVDHTEQELEEHRLLVYEGMRETDADSVSDLDAIVDLLDQREMDLEEIEEEN